MSSQVLICDRSALEAMHTGSLLTRLKKLQSCEESFSLSDRFGAEPEPDPQITGQIEFKDTSEWASAHRDLKEVLANREYFPTAAERRAKRKDGHR